jgi:hypothetical protein
MMVFLRTQCRPVLSRRDSWRDGCGRPDSDAELLDC